MKYIIILFAYFMSITIFAKDLDYNLTKIIHSQSPFEGSIYPMFMLNDENNNRLLVLDYFNSAILFYDLSKNKLTEVKQIDDKIKYYYIPKESEYWEGLNNKKGLFLIQHIFQDFKTQECFSGTLTINNLINGTLGRPTLYSNIKNNEFEVVQDFIKDSIYPRGANIAMNGNQLVFQGIRGKDWNDFLILYNKESQIEQLIISTDELRKFLKKDKIKESAGWCYFIDSVNILYYRFPDIPPIIINLNTKAINFVKLSGKANKTNFYFVGNNYIINEKPEFFTIGYGAINNSISSLNYNKNKQNDEIDSILVQLYDKNTLILKKEMIFKCPESDIKHINYVAGKDDKEYYLILVNKYKDIYIYKLSILDN